MEVLFRAEIIEANIKDVLDIFEDKIVIQDGRYYMIGEEYKVIRRDDGSVKYCYINGMMVNYNTRAIHFEEMIDSDKKPIFASLSEDGKGGDIVKCLDDYHWIAIYNKVNKYFAFYVVGDLDSELTEDWDNFKVIGIQK